MNDTTITLRGYVGGDVVLRSVGDTHVANFRLGATPRIFNKTTGEWGDGTTQWFTANVWHRLALNVKKSVFKGDPVVVHGRLVAKEWADANGVAHSTFEIEAEAVGHDLARGTTIFARPPRIEQAAGAEADERAAVAAELTPADGESEATVDPLGDWATPSAA